MTGPSTLRLIKAPTIVKYQLIPRSSCFLRLGQGLSLFTLWLLYRQKHPVERKSTYRIFLSQLLVTTAPALHLKLSLQVLDTKKGLPILPLCPPGISQQQTKVPLTARWSEGTDLRQLACSLYHFEWSGNNITSVKDKVLLIELPQYDPSGTSQTNGVQYSNTIKGENLNFATVYRWITIWTICIDPSGTSRSNKPILWNFKYI